MDANIDFVAKKFYFYNGPNYYLDRKALVFNLKLDPNGKKASFYEPEIIAQFPELENKIPNRVAELFAIVLIQILKMNINLFINKYDVSKDGEDHVIAVEYLDEISTEDSVYLACDWFLALNEGKEFDFKKEFEKLQLDFDRTLFGGPTLYSLIEAGLKRNIPVTYLFEENQFQWGYGKKQVRGRSTTIQKDSIKDTEFTMYKDIVKDFLLVCGFPTPIGKNCFDEKEIIDEAEKLGYPVVVKPLAGHKGQGVTTGIMNAEEVAVAFNKIFVTPDESSFEGAIVEQQINGTDHRLLTVGGKFAAGLQRVPAYVDGNGKDTIKQLIETENDTVARLDNARSALCKIHIDDDLNEFLELQNISIDSVPSDGEKIYLRRVANISAGGVSINVTDKVHPKNIKLVEDISKYFGVNCMGIDVLAEDISQPWDEGNFGIIEINAGPGVFMHLVPAIGESIDVPGKIMFSHFKRPECSRIPIIVGNNLSLELTNKIYNALKEIKPDIEFGSLTNEGLYFNSEYFCKNKNHNQNLKMLLRNPKLDIAVINHTQDEILDFGTYHEGSDIAILENPKYAEKILVRDVLENGYIVDVDEDKVSVSQFNDCCCEKPNAKQQDDETTKENDQPCCNNEHIKVISELEFTEENKNQVLFDTIKPYFNQLLEKYE